MSVGRSIADIDMDLEKARLLLNDEYKMKLFRKDIEGRINTLLDERMTALRLLGGC